MKINIFLIISVVFSLKAPELIHPVFSLHKKEHMMPIMNNLHAYTVEKKKNAKNYNTKEMLETYSNIYKDGCVEMLKPSNTSVYLGWVPLHNSSRMECYYKMIKKNIDFNVFVQNIPLYYIMGDVISTNMTLVVKKIIYNPIIELDIDLFLLKSDLYNLTEILNVSLDLSKLNRYDNGRWRLIWNNNYL
tara:strand:- start:26901 stop:27467 length:567 start_codon:yes stop_codon:yes gene_type:complete